MTTTVSEKPDINEMRVIHRVFRRELGALPELVRGVRDGDVARAGVVGGHAQFVLSALHVHHSGEDEYLWPLLLERAEPSTELIETMQAQHERVHEHVDRSQDLLDTWRRTPSSDLRGELAAELELLNAGALRAPRPGGARDPAAGRAVRHRRRVGPPRRARP